jgi:hypothetical protein
MMTPGRRRSSLSRSRSSITRTAGIECTTGSGSGPARRGAHSACPRGSGTRRSRPVLAGPAGSRSGPAAPAWAAAACRARSLGAENTCWCSQQPGSPPAIAPVGEIAQPLGDDRLVGIELPRGPGPRRVRRSIVQVTVELPGGDPPIDRAAVYPQLVSGGALGEPLVQVVPEQHVCLQSDQARLPRQSEGASCRIGRAFAYSSAAVPGHKAGAGWDIFDRRNWDIYDRRLHPTLRRAHI